MSKFNLTSLLLVLSSISFGQSTTTDGTQLLFNNVKCNLTAAEKNLIYKNLNFKLSKDKKQFASAEDEGNEFPFMAQVYPTDLNKDGKEEIFVVFGNSFTSGHAGSSVVLFIKNASGGYATNLGFPGTAPLLMPTSNKGYPDLLIGGPGFEFPVWRWNGKDYAHYKIMKEKELQNTEAKSLEEASSTYQKTLKNN